MLRTLALALALTIPASAQTTPDDVFPLDEGNRWVFVGSTSHSNTQGTSSTSYGGSVAWRVEGSVDTGSGTLPLVQITASNGNTTTCAVGGSVEGDVVSFPFYSAGGTGLCPAVGIDYRTAGGSVQTGFQIDLAVSEAADRFIGGVTYPVSEHAFIPSASACGSLCDVYYTATVGVGVSQIVRYDDFGPGATSYDLTLRRAEIGDATYGAPLDPGPGFFPLASGNRWVFAVGFRETGSGPYEPDGFIRWDAEGTADAPVLRVDRIVDGVRSPLGACAVERTEATATNAYRETVRLVDAPDDTCPVTLPYAVPTLSPDRLFAGAPNPSAGTVVSHYAETAVLVGEETVPTDRASGSLAVTVGAGEASYYSGWTLGRGIGVSAFYASTLRPSPNEAWRSALAYARVDGVEYGANPVSDEAPPSASTLGLTVAPNPSRGAARVTLSGEAAARVTVLDALGRVVRAFDAVPGTVHVPLGGLGAGVYLVRAETARGVASTRLTVVR